MDETQILTLPPAIKLATHNVSPPGGLYVQLNDVIQLSLYSSLQDVPVSIRVRLLLPDSTISFNSWDVLSGLPNIKNSFQFGLAEGYVLSAVVYTTANRVRGQIYARLQINRGGLNSNLYGQTMCQGYLTSQTGIFYPFGPNGYSLEGQGYFTVVSGALPAPGAEISELLINLIGYRYYSFMFTFTTSAVVGNRLVTLAFFDNALMCAQVIASAVQAASLTVTYLFSTVGVSNPGPVNNIQQLALPQGMLIRHQGGVKTQTIGLQAGDAYTAPTYYVEQLITS